MKSFRFLALLLGICFCFPIAAHAGLPEVSAHAAILMEASGEAVIYEKNARERLPMASTTKIMTALVALEEGDIYRTVSIPADACGVEGSSIYLSEGEELTLEELLYAMMLESANDAAAAIAIATAGSIEAFAERMNETAAALGLTDTHFTNPHGLDDPDHYTTAYDLARLTAYAMKNPSFAEITSTQRKTIPLRGEEGTRVLINHNKLLRLTEDAIGGKTGFTKRCGRCLASVGSRDGVTVIAVTLNAPDDWNDHLSLYEAGFAAYSCYTLASEGEIRIEIPCSGAVDGTIPLVNRDEVRLSLPVNSVITRVVDAPHILFAPVSEGEMLGHVRFFSDGKEVASLPLYAAQSVDCPAVCPSTGEKILNKLGSLWKKSDFRK